MIRQWFATVMGTAETRRLVRENIRSKSACFAAGHLYNQNPVAIFAYLYPVTLLLLGMMLPEYLHPEMSVMRSNLLTSGKVLIYWGVCWLVMGQFIWVTLRLGLPFIVVPVIMWLVAVSLSNSLSILLTHGAEWTLSRFLRQATLTLPGSIAITYAISHRLPQVLGEIPELVPIWLPIRRVRVPLLFKLPPDRRGRLLRIHAANQYVEVVTDAGTTLLRMGLREAVALLPAEKGWLCHRSLWIRRDEVMSLTYVAGQPQITDRQGKTYAISRSMVPEIRGWLAQQTQLESAVAVSTKTGAPAG